MKIRFPLWRPAVDDEVDEELDFHLAMRQRELMAAGMSATDARRAALERFGNYSRARRQCRAIGHQRERHMRLVQYLNELRQDVTFSVRQLFADRGFTVVAIATLALGIGATTAIFSAVNAVVLRPLPLPEPERLVVVSEGWRDSSSAASASVFLDVARTSEFEAVGAAQGANITLSGSTGAQRVVGARVSGGYLAAFGVPAALGRIIAASDDTPGGAQVVVLSDRLWTRQFARDPSIVGREITLNDRPHVVIGVMPEVFDLAATGEELWVPLALTPEQIGHRDEHYLTIVGRVRSGVTAAQLNQRLAAVMAERARVYPNETEDRWLRATSLRNQVVGDYRARLFALLGAVGLVLLIACGNVSNLLLARGTSRAREIALRGALGAGQGRIVRQLLTENLVLALVAAAAGVALARGLLDVLISVTPPGVPRLEQASIDNVALAFAAGLAIASSVIFGLVPAWRTSRTDVNATLKEAGRGPGSRGARDIVRSALIAGEVALALVLLVGAGLLIRSAIAAQRVAPGFDPTHLFTGRVLLSPLKYKTPQAYLEATRQLEAEISRLPGVTAAAISNTIPTVGTFSNGLLPEGAALELRNVTQSDGVFVSPSYFRTMGMRIVRGRAFDDRDRATGELVVILNGTAASQMWPGQDAIGKRLGSASPLGLTRVVGIVEDARTGGPRAPVPPTFYVPLAQLEEIAWGWTHGAMFVSARTSGDPSALAADVRRAVASIDPTAPLYSVLTMEQRMASTLEVARLNTLLLVALGVTGLILTAVGIYGVVAYFASQRTSEIGIRMALGATRRDVVRMMVRQAALPVVAGVVLGAAGSAIASRAIASELVGVTPTDPLTFAGVAGTILAVGLLAAFLPARRAAALDPTRALQS